MQRNHIPQEQTEWTCGVRVELPAVVFSHLTDELYERSVYRTEKFEDNFRTSAMKSQRIGGK